jgi:hypothetical protein
MSKNHCGIMVYEGYQRNSLTVLPGIGDRCHRPVFSLVNTDGKGAAGLPYQSLEGTNLFMALFGMIANHCREKILRLRCYHGCGLFVLRTSILCGCRRETNFGMDLLPTLTS